MKKILTLLLTLAMGLEGYSQTYYNWDFTTATTSTFPAGFVTWKLDAGTANTNDFSTGGQTLLNAAGWVLLSQSQNGGSGAAVTTSDFNSAIACNRWLVTPDITVPTGTPNVAMVWVASSGSASYPDQYEVRISTTDSATTSFGAPVQTITENGYNTTRVLPLGNYAGQTIRIAFRDITTNGYLLFLNSIKVVNLPSAAITVNDVEVYEHNYLNNPVSVTGLFTNTGLDNINTYVLNYSVNGGAAVSSPVNYNAGVLAQTQYIYTHPTPFNPTTAGTYTISVWFSDLNGSTATSDTSSTTVFFYPRVAGVVKNVLIEEMTGAGCPWCPGGALALRDVHDSLPYVIPVAIHSGDINDLGVTPSDAMQITDGQNIVNAYASGFPTGMVDRLYTFDNQTISPSFYNGYYLGPDSVRSDIWYQISVLRKIQATPLNVGISVVSFDSTTSTNNLTVSVSADFFNSLSQGTYNFNFYVVEDSVLTPAGNNGNGYTQDNGAYSSAAGQTTNYNELYNLPAVLLDNGQVGQYAQNHVLRAVGGGPWGTGGVIPSNPTAGSTYSHNFTVSVPSTWRYDYLKLVGFVQEYSSNPNLRTILNATEINLINAPRNCPVISVTGTQIGTSTSAYATATGGTAPYTYHWGSTPAQSTDTATGLTVGSSYTVTVTDHNGCTGTGFVTIAPASCPTITPTVALSAPTSSATVSATGGASPYTYIWNTTPAQTTATATGLTPGVTYTVTVIDHNGCIATTSATLDQCSAITSFAQQVGTSTSATVSAAGGIAPYTYTWSSSPVQTGATATGLTVGTSYTITVVDANGCSAVTGVTIEAACPTITVSANQVGGSSSATSSASGGAAPYTYSWSDGQTGTTATSLYPGSYTVTAVDNNGCVGTTTVSVVAGIRSIADITDFSVYPNPSTGIFTTSIHLVAATGVTITITDLTGNKVYESAEGDVKDLDKQINLGRVSAGMYFVNVRTAQGSANQRIIIK